MRDAATEPVLVEPVSTIQEASVAMLDGRVDAAILAQGGEVHGVVRAADVARALAEGLDVVRTPVETIADGEPPVARPDEALAEVHLRMRAAQRRFAVVVGPHGEPLGLLADDEAAS